MLKRFLQQTLPLILVGVALGLAGRWLLGIESSEESSRIFKQPIDAELLESFESERGPEISLDESYDRSTD